MPVMTKTDLESFRENGSLIKIIREKLADYAQNHHSKEAIEALAVALIREAGGEPAFMKVPGYSWATCINVNEQIVHSIPKGNFQVGDVVTIDLGMFFKGTTTDTATTIVIGKANEKQVKFLAAGKKALRKTLKLAVAGRRVRDLAETIQRSVEGAGYTVVRTLTGHGLGRTMHEEPAIPCFVSADPAMSVRLEAGMVLAIEVMYTSGDWRLVVGKDGWTQTTADNSLSAVFEQDVIVGKKVAEVIT